MKEKFIAYCGKKFRLEWYFDNRKKSEALEYYEQLTIDRQKKIAHSREKRRALKIKADYTKRCNDGDYYG